MPERLLDSTLLSQLVLRFQAPPAVVQERLPRPWRVSPLAAGPSTGANLSLLFNEAWLNQQGDGAPAAAASSRYLSASVPAVHPQSREAASFNLRVLTNHPAAVPGRYGTAVLAYLQREHRVEAVDLDSTVVERFEARPPGGGAVTLHLRYQRGMLARMPESARVRSAADPGILRVYRLDQVVDVVRSEPAGIDRVEHWEFRVTVPDLAPLFGPETRLVSITASPWQLRQVFSG